MFILTFISRGPEYIVFFPVSCINIFMKCMYIYICIPAMLAICIIIMYSVCIYIEELKKLITSYPLTAFITIIAACQVVINNIHLQGSILGYIFLECNIKRSKSK